MLLRKMSDSRSRFSIALFLLAAVPAGVLVGGLYYVVSRLMPLVLVDAFITALFALMVLVFLQRKAAVANPLLAFVFALLFSVFIYATYRYISYQWFRADALRYLETTNQMSVATATQEFEAELANSTGQKGLLGYLILQTRIGIGLAPMISYQGIVAPIGSGFKLTGALVWLLWLLEFLLIASLLTWIGIKSAQQPFAAAGVSRMGHQIGNVPLEQADEFAHQLKTEAFDAAWKLITFGGEASHPTVEVYTHQNRRKTTANSLVLAARTVLDQNGQVHREELFWTEVPSNRMPSQVNE